MPRFRMRSSHVAGVAHWVSDVGRPLVKVYQRSALTLWSQWWNPSSNCSPILNACEPPTKVIENRWFMKFCLMFVALPAEQQPKEFAAKICPVDVSWTRGAFGYGLSVTTFSTKIRYVKIGRAHV